MSEMIDQSPQEAPELVTSHFAIKKRGVGEKVNIWACEVGAQPASIGADMVVDTDPRGDDPNAILVEDANGSIRPQGAAEAAQAAVRAKMGEINVLRDTISDHQFFHDGRWYKCDARSKDDIIGTITDTLSGLPPTVPIEWIDADNNFVEILTTEAFKLIGRALKAHRELAVKNAAALKLQLLGGADPATLDITAGWPPNRVIVP